MITSTQNKKADNFFVETVRATEPLRNHNSNVSQNTLPQRAFVEVSKSSEKLSSSLVAPACELSDRFLIRLSSVGNRDAEGKPAKEFQLEVTIPRQERIALTREFMECLRGFAERNANMQRTKLKFAGLEMDLLRRTVCINNRSIALTQREFDLLEYFLRRPERVLTKENILEHVWDLNFEERSNVVEVYISALRKRLAQLSERPLIQTVRGVGYMLSEHVQ